MFALYLNPMMSNTETSVCVTLADTAEQLEEFLEQEQVEPYSETGPSAFFDGEQTFRKVFKKDGPLEMYNPPETSFCSPVGIIEIPTLVDIEEHYSDGLKEATFIWNSQFQCVPKLFNSLNKWVPTH